MPELRDPERLDRIAKHALDVRLQRYESTVRHNYREALVGIRNEIAKLYDNYAVNGVLTHAEMSKYHRMVNLNKDLTEILGPSARANKSLVDKMAKVEYEEGFYRFAWTMDQESGVALRWGLLNPDTVRAAVANPLREIAVGRLRADGRARIRTAVTQGLIRGESFPNMMKGIRTAINGNANDAMRIVRTEGQRAQVLGQQATYDKARDLGVEVTDIWDATLDSRTRTEHGVLDNVPAETDSEGNTYWNTAVGRVAGPTQSGVASFDINCRCRVTGGIEGYEPKLRRVRGEGVVPYQTYNEWQPPVRATGRNTVKAMDFTLPDSIKRTLPERLRNAPKPIPSTFQLSVDKMKQTRLPKSLQKASIDSPQYKRWIYEHWRKE